MTAAAAADAVATMTEGGPARMAPAAARPAPTVPPRRPGHGGVPALTWLAALTVFAVVLIVLAWRMLGGDDPALGAGQTEQTAAAPAKHVIVRRIIRRRIVVTTDVPAASGPVATSGGARTGGSRRVAVSAAPAPAASPAPAPVTRSS